MVGMLAIWTWAMGALTLTLTLGWMANAEIMTMALDRARQMARKDFILCVFEYFKCIDRIDTDEELIEVQDEASKQMSCDL